MAVYGIVEDNIVINRVEADEPVVLGLIYSDKLVVEETSETGFSAIGAEYNPDLNKFVPFQQYSKWVFDRKKWEWVPPVAMPKKTNEYELFIWNDETGVWDSHIIAPDAE